MRFGSVLLLAAFLAACGSAPAARPVPSSSQNPEPRTQNPTPRTQNPAPAFARGSVTIQTKNGPLTMPVEIADDEAKREHGLMNRTSLPANAGMLFVFQPPADAKQVGFWMKDTLIALSIAFIEPNLTIESIQDMQAQTENVHYAPRDYEYAIEANLGFFTNHGVVVGDRVTIGS